MTERPWQVTVCILWESTRGIEVPVEERRLVRIRGDEEHEAAEGCTCVRALRLDRYQKARDRLTSPLRYRPEGRHEEIDRNTAIAAAGSRLAAARGT